MPQDISNYIKQFQNYLHVPETGTFTRKQEIAFYSVERIFSLQERLKTESGAVARTTQKEINKLTHRLKSNFSNHAEGLPDKDCVEAVGAHLRGDREYEPLYEGIMRFSSETLEVFKSEGWKAQQSIVPGETILGQQLTLDVATVKQLRSSTLAKSHIYINIKDEETGRWRKIEDGGPNRDILVDGTQYLVTIPESQLNRVREIIKAHEEFNARGAVSALRLEDINLLRGVENAQNTGSATPSTGGSNKHSGTEKSV